jgi:hypothetical protein
MFFLSAALGKWNTECGWEINMHASCIQILFVKQLQTWRRQESLRLYLKKLTYKDTVVLIHATKAYRGSRGIAPPILNLGSERRWVVSFTPLPLYHPEKNPCSLLIENDAWWAPATVWPFCETETYLAPAVFRTPYRSTRSLVSTPNKL